MLSILAALAGCDAAQDLVRSPQAKMERAFAPPASVLAARDAVARSIGSAPQRAAFEAGFAQRTAEHVQRCGAGRSIGPFTRTADLRRYAGDEACRGEPPVLLDWLGQHRAAALLQQPAARRAAPLGTLRRSTAVPGALLREAVLASQADVGLLVRTDGRMVLLSPSNGAVLRDLPGPADAAVTPVLSPNGRLAAYRQAPGLWRVVDTDSGAEVWSPRGLHRLLAWLPGPGALLATDQHDQRVLLIDLHDGRRQPLEEPAPGAAWCWPDDATPDALWIGQRRELRRMVFERTGPVVSARRLDGLGASPLVRHEAFGPPLRLGGRWWLGRSPSDLLVLDLQQPNPQIEARRLAADFEGPVMLHDQGVLLHLPNIAGVDAWQVLDLARGQTATIAAPVRDARLMALTGRPGAVLLTDDAIWYGDRVDLPEADPAPAR